ncbi:N-6 DNA Methylase [Gemmata obscuriglobus]|uniref:site-specific DNA-methyltransferase (adenine-specific) n=1 Tax=Gemmata obscuriglobus TaxID=114 RepID=A0A2Z3HFM1_9BACT|nr:type I restriction endonuclease subunit M [Gemmata obscuriglobus]QEG32266.1 N-6 DNA Methylase [Gemmata obscuriglobus]VTS11622.1 restriction endonuclease subunit m : Uncharacterized protein OS=Pseudomonas aeruginosa BWHPSA043 GN=Q048_04881 PE=4 SV=1: N6_Mtase [Gemmata obscuriglobus UQM 2246]
MPSRSANQLRDELLGYGVAEDNVRIFGQQVPSPDLQDYLTLNSLRRKNRPSPDGVAEYQGRPVLYFVDEQRLGQQSPKNNLFHDEPDEIPIIFRQLACRGERVYLARIDLGKITVAPVSLTDKTPNWVEYTPGSTEGRSLFSRLAFGMAEGEDFGAGDAVFGRLFNLIKHTASKIARNESLRPDAISLVGRALFFRFLRDRGVLDNYSFSKIAPKALDWTECFRDAENSANTCAWLDKTFNGDFLPLTDGGNATFFERIATVTSGDVFRHLSAVVRGHQPRGNSYQPMLKWEWQEFDFAHIPVGLLSQVYEALCWEWTPREAKKTSQRYTPRNIAVTLLNEMLEGITNIEACRILDPACGAGVFLVLSFRRLYLERWRAAADKKRPDTAVIREILEKQLVGLDISEAALKLAALSLYLTAVELDPEPQPPDKLKFKNLRGRVLHNVREDGVSTDSQALGSLGAHVGKNFDGKFDIVVSNPPWTSLDKNMGKRLAGAYESIIKRVGDDNSVEVVLPDNNPDLPFLLRSIEWCKPGGRIGMALPARLLLKSAKNPAAARAMIFRLLRVDGIINGTNLADTLVWPKMNQPWMLLFATNERPPQGHHTYFVTLPLDLALNKAGQFRIDSESTRPIDTALATKKPWIWKTLSIGTMLDVEVIEKLKAVGEPLAKYWRRVVGKNRSGKGYQLAEKQDGLSDCSFLKGRPNLTSTDLFQFKVDTAGLREFTRDLVWRPRKPTIYDPPLALIRQSPGESREVGRALLCFDKVAYSEVFNGYSAAGHPDGELLARYLHLFVHSDIWLYYLLATSPEFGAERRRSRKADLEHCPIPPLENLTPTDRNELMRLSESLESNSAIPWDDVDTFFAKLYQLRDYDLQVIRDTLAVALPYERSRERACRPATEAERATFIAYLAKAISPIVTPAFGTLHIHQVKSPAEKGKFSSPFDVLFLTTKASNAANLDLILNGGYRLMEEILQIADETGATQIIHTESSGLVVGIFNHFRYWTISRARLLAGDIIRLHLDAITG